MLELKSYTVINDYVTVHYRDDRRHVRHTAAPRGGCLWLGEIVVTNLANGQRKNISSTMPIFDQEDAQRPERLAYLNGLWEKFLLK